MAKLLDEINLQMKEEGDDFMLKKFVGHAFAMLLTVSTSVSAMTFSQPIRLGGILNTPCRGFVFEGESSNTGNLDIGNKFKSGKKDDEKVYKDGIATFGNGVSTLYVHYDDDKEINITFGNKDGKNVFTLYDRHMIEEWCGISKIETDSGLVLYVLDRRGGDWSSENCSIIGRREDGVFVKYFDMVNIRKMYFAKPRYVHFTKIYTQGDSIIINYEYFYPNSESQGEFRFKWDDDAQWFGVEQVVY